MSDEVLWEGTETLTCEECGDRFEVSASIAEAMWHWKDESGDPIICADCCPAEEIP